MSGIASNALPQDEQAGQAAPETPEQRDQRMAILEAFSLTIKAKRTEAIDARKSSGIEEIWQEDEEHYEGIDDANRTTTRMLKGTSMSDGLREQKKDTSTRSTVFLKLTRPYVDGAAARVSDMLLPSDDRNFAVKHTPSPELTAMLQDTSQANSQPQAAPGASPPQQPGGLMARIGAMFGAGQGVPPAVPPAQPKTVADVAQDTIDKATKAAELAQQTIDDWLVECRYHAEVRKVIEAAAKVGTGILKGPIPRNVKRRAAKETPDGWEVEMLEEIKPQSQYISHWNFYPMPDCGNDIHKGSGVFESDEITARALLDLKRDPNYIASNIDECIAEGPISATEGTESKKQGDKKTGEKDLFQIWYFTGQVSKADMEAAGCSCGDKDYYPAIVAMVNNRIVKVNLSMLDSGEYPYDVMVWQARPDHWAGVGVARQMRECQKGANAAARNLMDNAGLSAGPQFIVDRNKLVPANGKWEVTPRKFWYTRQDVEMEDARRAFMIVSIETRQAELLNIIQFWSQKAEEVTGLPMLLQGQFGSASTTDKVGIANIMNNNGSTVLRRIARTFDDRVTEPHIGRYYEWLLLYGPNDAKGDFTINARGSSALVERDMQAQTLVQLVGMSLQPAYGLDPELVMKEFLKSMRFDTQALEMSDEKKQALANKPPPEDPRITAAKIVTASREKVSGDQLVGQAQIEKLKQDGDNARAAAQRQLDQMLKGIDERLAYAELSSDERQHLETQKVLLAKTTLQLRTQQDLFVGGAMMDEHQRKNPPVVPQVATPGTEPPQRAPNGQAFIQ